jgi:hypothetical protein
MQLTGYGVFPTKTEQHQGDRNAVLRQSHSLRVLAALALNTQCALLCWNAKCTLKSCTTSSDLRLRELYMGEWES